MLLALWLQDGFVRAERARGDRRKAIAHAKGTSLVVQWLRFRAPDAGGLGLIPRQGTRSHMPQLRVHMSQLKILHVATKPNKLILKKKSSC